MHPLLCRALAFLFCLWGLVAAANETLSLGAIVEATERASRYR
jgi:hypothetical protein